MSEPHEMEERLRVILLSHLGAGSPRDQGSFRAAVHDVMKLVRQEQEKDSYINVHGIKHWWLSHTAKETNNE